ncbi:MAG: HEAT repeat domain-containing protein [Devosiaceae bacterium]|nr:HEAT repeat domain-containing protein [Devosiaceae bacterium]
MSELMIKDDNNSMKLSESLKKILSENNEVEQCLAVQALGGLEGKGNLAILIEHLRNPDEDVRCDVGKALCLIKDESLIAPLLENLIQDPIGEAKVIYIAALEVQGAIQCADILCVLAEGRGIEENIAWEEYGTGWDDWLDVQIAAIKTLGVFAEQIDRKKAIKAILAGLNDPEGQDLWAIATRALVKFGDEGGDALIDLMRQASALKRKSIAIALGEGQSEQSVSLLSAAMQDPDINVRKAAIKSGAKRNLKEIYMLGIEDGSADVRAKTLSEFNDLDDGVLEKALDDLQEKVQISACEAIINDKKIRPKLKLVKKAQQLLRKNSPKLLSALIGAMAVAKPKGASDFIEDIVNHSATDFAVRLACLRALGNLNSSKSVSLLSSACADENQETRLAAIGSLGKIATGKGANAEKSIEIISSAILGNLVSTPKDWQPKEDNIVDFDKHKGAKQDADEDARKIRLDREGNIIEAPLEPINSDIEIEEKEVLEPLSTLDAIMAANVEVPACDNAIKIDEADIEFLEMTGSAPKKRKRRSPMAKIPAHIDVRRLAALVGGETGRGELLEALIKAAADSDKELCEASIEAIACLAKAGIDISDAQRVLLRHATTGEASLSFRAIRALGYINSSIVSKVVVKLSNDENDLVRSEAIKISKNFDIELDLASLCKNGERKTRIAAAELVSELSSDKAIPALCAFAFIEDGVHKKLAAKLLNNHEAKVYDVMIELLNSDDPQKRIIALEILIAMQQ